mgnify:CR=1 FL=1
MIITMKLYICKSHEHIVQKIIHNDFLLKLKENFSSIINPINPKFPYLYEKYENTDKSGIILYITIPIKLDKKKLLTQKTGYNSITKNIFTSKFISKYIQTQLTRTFFQYFHNHEDINMKSTSLKYLHVDAL